MVYQYTQDREHTCGNTTPYVSPDGKQFYFTVGSVYRLTQYIKVNTPNIEDGQERIWINGVKVYDRNDIRWRGAVSASVARVSQIMYHSYFGGKGEEFAPANDSYIDYGAMFVMSCVPDFIKAPGTCKGDSGTAGTLPCGNNICEAGETAP
jgi:hypothetical protein